MAIAKRFWRQAATCAALAKQTRDEDDRQRYLRLEQTYIELAEAEERAARSTALHATSGNMKPAA